jgi:pullulanase
MKYLLSLVCILAMSHGYGARKYNVAGPARAQWVNRDELVLKTHLSVRNKQDFLLKTSQDSISLRVRKNENGRFYLSLPSVSDDQIEKLIRSDLQLVVLDQDGHKSDQTSVQLSGLLDDVYADDGTPLGISWKRGSANLFVWAPTARKMEVALYKAADTPKDKPDQLIPMNYNKGFWSAEVPPQWKNLFYTYKVEVYEPRRQDFRTYFVTDPYSVGLTMNSQKSQLLDVDDSSNKPSGWDSLQKPALQKFTDIVIYETHLRDLTIKDDSMPGEFRGTYKAFNSNYKVARYLKDLAGAGLTHIHFLPMNDFATVNEDKSKWKGVPFDTGNWSDSTQPQSELEKVRDQDPYNWGYDPVHWMTPEGSYATSPLTRTVDFRGMVKDLNSLGLRVVIDVVFNHTFADQDNDFSVLDRLVPLYYYRYDDEGRSQSTSCCADTASENHMMERLMVDSIVFWAKAYKIDGFRFDLMSFHSKNTMKKIRDALNSLSSSRDGVDGRKIYMYGEGWEFGSYFAKDPNNAMTQKNSYGLSIGTFNDRIRDALRGGTTDPKEKSDQGFLTGLFYDFNQEPANRNTPPDLNAQKEKLLQLQDVIKVGLAGNLRDFSFTDYRGQKLNGGDLQFRGQPVGYAANTIETVNYVSAHDGYCLWDAIQAKSPFSTPDRNIRPAPTAERVRMAWMGLASVVLSQGVAFVEGGSELLRSKSGDADSYDSGDWFNAIDWSFSNNNWAVGLPPSWRNRDDWSFWSPRLQDSAMRVSQSDIQATNNYFKALLAIRKRFRAWQFSNAVDMMTHTDFLENRRGVTPGVIAFRLENDDGKKLILFNATNSAVTFENSELAQDTWTVAPELSAADPIVKSFKVQKNAEFKIPARTTVVLEAN